MGSLFRSEEMTLCQLFLQSEAAYSCVSELGELGLVQFRDLNPDVNAFQRKFVNEVRRCEEMERKLRYLEKEIKKDGIPMMDIGDNLQAPQPREMTDLEATFEKLENELREVNTYAETLKKTYLELIELKHILCKTQQFFDEGDEVYKSVFIIFFQGEQLKSRVKKICEGFHAMLYSCPETPADRREMSSRLKTRIEDMNTVLGETQEHRHRVLVTAAENIKNWFVKVCKIKAIYHTLNLFNLDVTQKCLIAECWCAVWDLDKIQLALRRGTERSGSSVPSILNCMDTKETPPTYNRTNKLTRGFQNIVDAYGVACYREVNPAPFTIITFPFLFAVMFGDAGHGLLMTLFALWMVLKEKALAAQKWNSEIWNTIFGGRYIILLMGIFSMYTGLIYNDIFSKSFNIFGTSWMVRKLGPKEHYRSTEMLDPQTQYVGSPYPFGIDPVWQVSQNNIDFLNSYKKKISVILGVGQMLFGVVLSLWNHCYFRKRLNIICEFIPQMIFLLSIFGYMILLVFVKWVHYKAENSNCAPSILILLINMFLMKYPDKPCSVREMYTGQQVVQIVLVALAVICIPWMLLVKPFLLRKQWSQRRRLMDAENAGNPAPDQEGTGEGSHQDGTPQGEFPAGQANVTQSEEHHISVEVGGDHGTEEEFDFTEIFIHQAIHTIEYCLGSISHTASYLRLWALSLAHAQLSEVLWTMVMQNALRIGGWAGVLVMYFIFAVWAALTVSILLVMEGLSAFLHALRLHWVEFQSKFYGGDGYMFTPFSFETILETSKD